MCTILTFITLIIFTVETSSKKTGRKSVTWSAKAQVRLYIPYDCEYNQSEEYENSSTTESKRESAAVLTTHELIINARRAKKPSPLPNASLSNELPQLEQKQVGASGNNSMDYGKNQVSIK